jgi:hypothetical protein
MWSRKLTAASVLANRKLGSKVIYCWFSKEMSSLYFGLDGFCFFEARAPEFVVVYISKLPSIPVEEVLCLIGKTPASKG